MVTEKESAVVTKKVLVIRITTAHLAMRSSNWMVVTVPVIIPPRRTETASTNTRMRSQFPPLRRPRADKTFLPSMMVLIGSSAHRRKEIIVLRRAETAIKFLSIEG
jgi:hypothetical protein